VELAPHFLLFAPRPPFVSLHHAPRRHPGRPVRLHHHHHPALCPAAVRRPPGRRGRAPGAGGGRQGKKEEKREFLSRPRAAETLSAVVFFWPRTTRPLGGHPSHPRTRTPLLGSTTRSASLAGRRADRVRGGRRVQRRVQARRAAVQTPISLSAQPPRSLSLIPIPIPCLPLFPCAAPGRRQAVLL
jgi:hypothetical protein